MQKIKIKNTSLFVLVDTEDFERLNKYVWCLSWYGGAHTYINKRPISMSNLILTKDKEVDHINRDRFDNRKSNLRYCTRRENQQNRGKFKNCASGIKGAQLVSNRKGLWRSRIVVNGKKKSLGYFKTEKGAGLAYDSAAIKYFGKFALTNVRP